MRLAVCAVVKDEAAYLREWIEFHLLQGVEHFFMYDNDSSDETEEILRAYAKLGIVTYEQRPGSCVQTMAYLDCLIRHGLTGPSWLAFIDADEFLFSPTGAPVTEILDGFTGASAVVANWRVYGTSFHDLWSPEPVIERFTWRALDRYEPNIHVKSIVRPTHVALQVPTDPHSFAYKPGRYAVDELGHRVDGPFRKPPTCDLLRINHYWSKSVEEAERKAAIPRADNGTRRVLEQLLDEELNEAEDPIASSLYGDTVKVALSTLGF